MISAADAQSILATLRQAKSIYLQPLEALSQDIEAQLQVAQDNVAVLQALEQPCKTVAASPLQVPPVMMPVAGYVLPVVHCR